MLIISTVLHLKYVFEGFKTKTVLLQVWDKYTRYMSVDPVYSPHFRQSTRTAMIANPARGQLNIDSFIYFSLLSTFAPQNLILRDKFGRPVPRQPANSLHPG